MSPELAVAPAAPHHCGPDRRDRVAVRLPADLDVLTRRVLQPGRHLHLIDDRALAVTTGGLVGDSAPMMRPDRGGTTSPFYRAAGLRLWTIEEMQLRYDEFAAAEFDRTHGGQRGGHVDETGVVQLDEVPENPYRKAA